MIFAQDTLTGETVDFRTAIHGRSYNCIRCGSHEVDASASGFYTEPGMPCYSETSTADEDAAKLEISKALGAKCEVHLNNGTFVDVLFESGGQRIAIQVVNAGSASFHDHLSREVGVRQEGISSMWVMVGPSLPTKRLHRWIQAGNGGFVYQFLRGSLVQPVCYEGKKKKMATPVDLGSPDFRSHVLGAVWERDFRPI